MQDAMTDIAEPRAEKPSAKVSPAVAAHEAQSAISKTFPYEGDLRVRFLWSSQGGAKYRANWYRQVDGEMRVVTSMLLGITRTADGLIVRDETVSR